VVSATLQVEKANVALYKQLNFTPAQRSSMRALWLRWLAEQEASRRSFITAAGSATALPADVPTAAIVAISAVAAGGKATHFPPTSWTTRLIGASALTTARAADIVSAFRRELHYSWAQFVAMNCAINNPTHGLTVDQTHWVSSTQLDPAFFATDSFRNCQLASEEAKHESRRSYCPIS
jgi:hypothetical protein